MEKLVEKFFAIVFAIIAIIGFILLMGSLYSTPSEVSLGLELLLIITLVSLAGIGICLALVYTGRSES